jgi:hypothetical protein
VSCAANSECIHLWPNFARLLDQLTDQPYPVEVAEKPRGRVSHGRPPTLPDGWLNDPDENVAIELEDAISGG